LIHFYKRMLATRLFPRIPGLPHMSQVLGSQISYSQLAQHRLLSTSKPYAVRGRNKIVAGASNPQDLSQEARTLLQHAKDPDDLSWQPGYGIGEPLSLDVSTEERTRALQYEVPYLGYASKVDNGVEVIKYWPHRGEELSEEQPSPVLMVTLVKTLKKEHHWVKSYCDQIGLGAGHRKKFGQIGSRVFLPNLPSVCALLYKIKHVVDITPITFPKGMPEDFHPDTHGFKLTPKGEFIVEGPPPESLESVASRAEWMKLSEVDVNREARRVWESPYGSPLGNSNYHRHTGYQHDSQMDSEFAKNQRKKWS